MAKKSEQTQMNLYYMGEGQANNNEIDEKTKQKKAKEREKRIKERNKKDDFDLETETVIQMTNKNNLKKEQQKRKDFTRQERKRQKKIKRIKFFFKLILFIGLIAGGIVFALTSPIFNIKEIRVLENSQITTETIISISKLFSLALIIIFIISSIFIKSSLFNLLPGTIFSSSVFLPNIIGNCLLSSEISNKYPCVFMYTYFPINSTLYVGILSLTVISIVFGTFLFTFTLSM